MSDERRELVDRRIDWSAHLREHSRLQAEVDRLRNDAVQDRLHVDALEKLIDRAEGAISTWRFIASFLGVGGVATLIVALYALLQATIN